MDAMLEPWVDMTSTERERARERCARLSREGCVSYTWEERILLDNAEQVSSISSYFDSPTGNQR